MRMNSYIRYPSVAVPYFVLFGYMPLRFVKSLLGKKTKKRTKHERGAHLVLYALPRSILAPSRRSRRSKVKAHDPVQRWDHSFQVCCRLLLYPKNTGEETTVLGPTCMRVHVFLSRRILFYGSKLCIVQSDYVPCLGKCSFAAQACIKLTKYRDSL